MRKSLTAPTVSACESLTWPSPHRKYSPASSHTLSVMNERSVKFFKAGKLQLMLLSKTSTSQDTLASAHRFCQPATEEPRHSPPTFVTTCWLCAKSGMRLLMLTLRIAASFGTSYFGRNTHVTCTHASALDFLASFVINNSAPTQLAISGIAT